MCKCRVRLTLVPSAEQQDKRPRHALHGHERRADVGGLGVVQPEPAVGGRHRLQPVRQRMEGAQPVGDPAVLVLRVLCCDSRRYGIVERHGGHDRECGSEGVGDIVIADQRKLVAAHEWCAAEIHDAGLSVVPGIGLGADAE